MKHLSESDMAVLNMKQYVFGRVVHGTMYSATDSRVLTINGKFYLVNISMNLVDEPIKNDTTLETKP
jgi:hypothetical protein